MLIYITFIIDRNAWTFFTIIWGAHESTVFLNFEPAAALHLVGSAATPLQDSIGL